MLLLEAGDELIDLAILEIGGGHSAKDGHLILRCFGGGEGIVVHRAGLGGKPGLEVIAGETLANIVRFLAQLDRGLELRHGVIGLAAGQRDIGIDEIALGARG